jgi:triosephosphate isomerase
MKILAANWKMNGTLAMGQQYAQDLRGAPFPVCDHLTTIIAPPATYLHPFRELFHSLPLAWAGQDCSAHAEPGAHTGDISASMLYDCGARYVIVGHSERRQAYQENEELLSCKLEAAITAGLTPIFCIGESLEQRQGHQTHATLTHQISALKGLSFPHLIVAYEPVWAIGTGLVPTLGDLEQDMLLLKQHLTPWNPALLYGGSVTSQTVGDICRLSPVDGVLVGGASLKSDNLLSMAQTLAQLSAPSIP